MSLAPFLSFLYFLSLRAIFSTTQPFVITLLIVMINIETNFFNTVFLFHLFVFFVYGKMSLVLFQKDIPFCCIFEDEFGNVF